MEVAGLLTCNPIIKSVEIKRMRFVKVTGGTFLVRVTKGNSRHSLRIEVRLKHISSTKGQVTTLSGEDKQDMLSNCHNYLFLFRKALE